MLSSLLQSRSRHGFVTGALALFILAGCTTAPTPPAPSLATLDYAGSQAPAEAIDREIAQAGNDSARLAPIAAQLIQIISAPSSTIAGRQAASQRLGVFPAELVLRDDATRTLFATMLRSDQQVDFARLALDRIPGEAVDALYIDAVKNPHLSRARIGAVQSAGNRRIARAVEPLAALLKDPDYETSAAATKALGQIGTPEALRALETAPVRDSSIVVEARLAAAHRIGGSDALTVYHEIFESSAAPANLRGAALRGLLELEPAQAPQRIVDAIDAGDPAIVPVVLEAIATLPATNLVPVLAAKLPTWTTRAQVAVIAAFGTRCDPAAIPVLSQAAESGEADVKLTALAALGQLPGTTDVATLLARHVASGEVDEKKVARASLTRLNGPEVAATITAGAAAGDEPVRVAFIEQFALRNMNATISQLLNFRRDSSATIRAAALSSLAELAPADQQAAVLEWAISASDSTEQSRALRALASITLRNPDLEARAQPIVQAIDHADSATALRLLPVLPRIGGSASANAAARLALRDDPALSRAATASLARWPDQGGLSALLDVIEKTSQPDARSAELDQLFRELARRRDVPSAEFARLISRTLAITTDNAKRQQLVYLLGRCNDPEALALAQKFRRDPVLAEDASDAILAIRSNREGHPVVRASTREGRATNLFDGDPLTRWYAPAKPDQWLELDFKTVRPFRYLRLDGDGGTDNYPERLEIFVTDDLKKPGKALAVAGGQPGKVEITLPRGTRGKYLIIRHTGSREESAWSVSELMFD